MNSTLLITALVALVLLGLNLVLVWYIRQLFRRLNSSVEDHKDLSAMLGSFSEHLKSIHELELYYGDETLSNLLRHSRAIVEELELYGKEYTLGEEEAAESEEDSKKNEIEE